MFAWLPASLHSNHPGRSYLSTFALNIWNHFEAKISHVLPLSHKSYINLYTFSKACIGGLNEPFIIQLWRNDDRPGVFFNIQTTKKQYLSIISKVKLESLMDFLWCHYNTIHTITYTDHDLVYLWLCTTTMYVYSIIDAVPRTYMYYDTCMGHACMHV